jgi:hypothetical protein
MPWPRSVLTIEHTRHATKSAAGRGATAAFADSQWISDIQRIYCCAGVTYSIQFSLNAAHLVSSCCHVFFRIQHDVLHLVYMVCCRPDVDVLPEGCAGAIQFRYSRRVSSAAAPWLTLRDWHTCGCQTLHVTRRCRVHVVGRCLAAYMCRLQTLQGPVNMSSSRRQQLWCMFIACMLLHGRTIVYVVCACMPCPCACYVQAHKELKRRVVYKLQPPSPQACSKALPHTTTTLSAGAAAADVTW